MILDLLILDKSNTWQSLEVHDTDITMTKAFSDMEDPASINAAYTLNCTLPFTDKNIAVLGNLYRLDFVKGSIAYDQRERYKCKVLYNEETIYEGDFVLDSTTINDDISANKFNCTIYDEMYSMFKKLDYTLADPAESYDGVTDRFININAIDSILSPELAVSSFKTAGAMNDVMSYTNGVCNYRIKNLSTNDDICQFFGFMPTYRKNDDISEDEVFVSNFDGTDKYTGYAEPINKLTDMSNLFPHNIYPECLMQTWKAYNLKPYVWYSSYVQFLIAEIYRATGYKVDMSTDFFKANNPFYANLVRTLKYPKTDDEKQAGGWKTISTYDANFQKMQLTNEESTWQPATKNIGYSSGTRIHFDPDDLNPDKKYRIVFTANTTVMNKMDNGSNFKNCDARVNKFCHCYLDLNERIFSSSSPSTHIAQYMHNYAMFMRDTYVSGYSADEGITLDRVKQNITTSAWESQDSYITFPNSMSNYFYFSNGNIIAGLDPSGQPLNNSSIRPDSVLLTYTKNLSKSDIASYISANADYIDFNIYYGYARYSGANYVAEPQFHFDTTRYLFDNITFELQEYTEPKVSILDFFGDNFNILEKFTEFIKIFNLVCKLNPSDHTIKLYERGEYFNVNDDGRTSWQDKLENWTDYINLQDDLEHTAILSEYKDLLFTYEDRETANNVKSKSESNYNAGTYAYDLALPVNTESKNYLEGLYNSYIGKVKGNWMYDAIINHDRAEHPLSLTPNIYIDVDANGDALDDVEGQLLFRMESNYLPADYQSGSNTRGFMICSDTPYEIEQEKKYMPYFDGNTNNYTFIEVSDELPRIDRYYPKDLQAGSSYCSEWVDCIGNEVPNPQAFGLFQTWHKAWNDILYGYPQYLVPSIKVTAYFHIPMEVYKKFDFSHLIMIENNVYLVLSIDEYCFGNEVMKATLLQLRGVANLDSIDPLFGTEYLKVTPHRISLPPANTAKQFTYTVYSHDISNVQAALGTLPDWIATWTVVNTILVTANQMRVTVSYTTNANYPQTKAPYTVATTYVDPTIPLTDTLEISNIPSTDIDIDNDITVTPTLTVIPNNNNANSIVYTVTTNSNFDTATTSGAVINSPSFSVRRLDATTYEVTMNFHNTTGQSGVQQTVTFSNMAGQTCTAVVERDFEHQISIIPEKNGDDKLFLLDYKNLSDPLYSEFHFYVRTNFNFKFDDWSVTMDDHNQICWDKNVGDMELYEGANKLDYQTFVGNKNTVYHFYWKYPRKLGGNTGDYDGHFNINCIDGHRFTKKVNVSAQIPNNTLH